MKGWMVEGLEAAFQIPIRIQAYPDPDSESGFKSSVADPNLKNLIKHLINLNVAV